MQIAHIEAVEGGVQIGGGAGWVADRVRDGMDDARTALDLVRRDWNKPAIGPHPREAALDAAREAVAHLTEALTVEAPEAAIDETRKALEELGTAVRVLERMQGRPPFVPIDKPVGNFEGAITLLERVEKDLRHATIGFG